MNNIVVGVVGALAERKTQGHWSSPCTAPSSTLRSTWTTPPTWPCPSKRMEAMSVSFTSSSSSSHFYNHIIVILITSYHLQLDILLQTSTEHDGNRRAAAFFFFRHGEPIPHPWASFPPILVPQKALRTHFGPRKGPTWPPTKPQIPATSGSARYPASMGALDQRFAPILASLGP